MKELLQGFRYLLHGLRLIREPRLRRYVVVPLAINCVLFGTLMFLLFGRLGMLSEWIAGYLPDWLAWLRYVVWTLLVGATLVIAMYSFTLIANLLAAPFNGFLAAAVERHLTGTPLTEGTTLGLVREIAAGIASELRKLGYFLLRAIPLGLLFLVPGVNLLAPLLWFLFAAWILCLEYADFPMANHGMLFAAQRERIRRQRMTGLGFGIAVLGLTMVPVLNFVAMPAAVAGATVWWVERLRR